MRCDLLSVALAVPHLGENHVPIVLRALRTSDPIKAIRESNYGPAGRSENAHLGMTKRPILSNLFFDLAAESPI